MINVIVATHGPLANALLASGRMVYGELPHVFAVTLGEQAGIEGFRDAGQRRTKRRWRAGAVRYAKRYAVEHRLPARVFLSDDPPGRRRGGSQFPDAAAKRRGSPFNGCARCCRTAAGVNRTDTGHGCPDDIRSVR